jgi:exosome complex protein LRP1
LIRFPERTEVDKDAAGRFIKHAISQAMLKSNTTISPTSSSVPIKVTTKMIARAQYEHTLEKERQEQGEEEEEELQVYDEPESSYSSGAGDQGAADAREKAAQTPSPGSKRRRQVTDSFAST